jgi:hypothetical protein
LSHLLGVIGGHVDISNLKRKKKLRFDFKLKNTKKVIYRLNKF